MQKGFGMFWIVAVIAFVALMGGAYLLWFEPKNGIMEKESPSDGKEMKGDAMLEKMDGMEAAGNKMGAYKGKVLAGSQSLLLDFNNEDYAVAVRSGKLIVLYFYANWCPICREEFPKMEAAFNALRDENVIGFRVNYNDSETDSSEVALAREFGVAYQHTKVFLTNGQRILKSPESWSMERYQREIQKALPQ